MFTLDFKYFVGSYVSIFGEITSWKELQIWFNEYERDKREQKRLMKLFRGFSEK